MSGYRSINFTFEVSCQQTHALTSFDTVFIVRVHHKYQSLGVLVIVPPQRPDFVLPSYIPHGEANILVFDGLNVESWSEVEWSLDACTLLCS
jgi:hypothetical protein